MIFGDEEIKAMIRVLGQAISRIASGERSMELFGVGEDGEAEDVVLIMIHGDDWEEIHRRIGDLYDIENGTHETHTFGNPEDN